MESNPNPERTKFVHAPNSIYDGAPITSLTKAMHDRIIIERNADFLEWLFNTHCDHITQNEAWKEFEEFEINNM